MRLVGAVGEQQTVEVLKGEAAAQLLRHLLHELLHVLLLHPARLLPLPAALRMHPAQRTRRRHLTPAALDKCLARGFEKPRNDAAVAPRPGGGILSRASQPDLFWKYELPRTSRPTRPPATGAQQMIIGVPKEIKNNEFRVAITAAGVHEFRTHGHAVLVERGAGLGSGITDEEYAIAGAEIVAEADDVWARADMVMKVKEPVKAEYHRFRKGLILFTYLHLAAEPELTQELINSGVTAIAYETVQEGRDPAAAGPDVRGRRPPVRPGRRHLPDGPGRRQGRAARRRPGRPPGQGRCPRRRRRRHQRRRHGPGPRRRRHHPGHQHQPPARTRRPVPGPPEDRRVQRLRDREVRGRRRPRHRLRPDPRRQGPEARHQRARRPG